MAAPRDLGRGQDAAIKLFGCTISVLDASAVAAPEVSTKLANGVRSNNGMPCLPNNSLNVKESSFGSKNKQENDLQAISSQHGKMESDSKYEEVMNGSISSQLGKMGDDSKPEEVKTESDGSEQEKVFKKPDNILPCPRCNSMETKFCYFNNYNINQPRHYCRSCKRYWTVGGTMRNVPLGSGRRRNRHPSNYHDLPKPRELSIPANEDFSAATHQSLAAKPHVLPDDTEENGTVFKSASEVVFCKSVSPVLDTKKQNDTDLASLASGDSKEDKSCASSAVISGSSENWIPETTIKKEQDDLSGYSNGGKVPHPNTQPHCAGPAMVFSRNPAAVMEPNRCSTDGIHDHGPASSTASPISLLPPPLMPSMGIRAPAIPFPLVPPFLSCIPGWPNGEWSAPWPGSNGPTLLSPPISAACSGSNSVVLGKHLREANLQEEEKTEKKFWVPKALRIDNPEEAAKSTIWASLGIKPDERIVFKSSSSKDQKNSEMPESTQALQANPAAFSR